MTAVESKQWERLSALLTRLRTDNPFQARKLAVAGSIDSLEAFKKQVPLTTKEELAMDQDAHPPYGSNRTEPDAAYIRYSQTSGTQGRPLRWLDTAQTWQWMLDCWQLVFDAAGVRRAETLYFAFSFGPFLGFWTAWDAAVQRGCRCVPGGGVGTAARTEMLRASGATVLLCTPTYAVRLGEYLRAHEIVNQVRLLIIAGEPGGSAPETRRRILDGWPGAAVVDHHGMTETGPVSVQCPGSASILRALEEDYIVEVIDPETLAAVPMGGSGELVLTNLGRGAMPLLRYRTGDLVRTVPGEAGALDTRRFIGFEGGILGRRDDMIVVRGVNLQPLAVECVVRRFEGIGEFRVLIEEKRGMIEARLEIEAVDPCIVHQLEEALEAAFALRLPVALAAPGSLPRFEMKSSRWVRNPITS